MKKLLSLLVTVALLLSMSIISASAEEPTTLTIGALSSLPNIYLKNPVVQKICAEMNINLELVQYDTDTFNLLMTGGLADITMASADYAAALVNNKIAKNIYPYLDEFAPNIKGEAYSATLTSLQEVSGWDDEELYILPMNTGIVSKGGYAQPQRGYVIRWDYYKEIGCPEIKNDEDFMAALVEMQANHPETAAGNPTYAIGVERGLGNMGGYRASFLSSQVSPWVFGSYLYRSSFVDNILHDCYTEMDVSPYWVDVDFYHKLNVEGLFDPDSFTMTYDDFIAKVNEGTYMGLYYFYNALYEESLKTDPDTLAGYVVIPSEGAVSFANETVRILGNYPAWYIIIPEESANYETALKFLNYMFDPEVIRDFFSGIKGEDWDYDENGTPVLFDSAFEKLADGSLYPDTMWIPYNANSMAYDGQPYDLFNSETYRSLSLNKLQKDMCEYYGQDYPTQKHQELVEAGLAIDLSNNLDMTIYACVEDMPLDIKRILNSCNDILSRAMPKLIMAESDEEYDNIVAETLQLIEEAGEATAWDWATEQWNTAKDKVDTALAKVNSK